jgi:hypothetical protein
MLVQLADPTTRAALFDDVALAQILGTAYDASVMALDGPFQPIFENLRIGLAVPKFATIDGYWCPTGSPDKVDTRLQITGFGDASTYRLDALWQGRIVARRTLSSSTISQVTTTWPSLGSIDAEIIRDLGALPTNGAQLESQRRTRLLAHIRSGMRQPDAFTEAVFDAWMASNDVPSVGALVADYGGTLEPAAVTVQFTADNGQSVPEALPVTVALLIRDATVSIADLLTQSKEVRQKLGPLGLGATPDSQFPLREPVVIGWIVPASLFDDTDWPGANRATRRANAGAWLATEGIGLVATG